MSEPITISKGDLLDPLDADDRRLLRYLGTRQLSPEWDHVLYRRLSRLAQLGLVQRSKDRVWSLADDGWLLLDRWQLDS